MPLLIYTLAGIALLWLVHRFVCPLSRAAAVFLFFLPFLFVGHALVANRVYAPVDKIYLDIPLSQVREQYGIGAPHNPATADIFSQMIPWRHAVRESVARGEWPLWNPTILSGDILAAAAQPAPYSPFTLLALLMPAPISFTFTAAMTFLVAAAGAFAFARDVGCRELAASIAATGFAFSSAVALYVLWPLGLSWALLPLVMLGARRASFGLLTVGLTLLLLAGHPESVLHIVVIGAAYGAFELFRKEQKLRAVGRAFAAGMVALLLSAIFLLPYFEALPQTAEYDFRGTWRQIDRSAKTEHVLLTLATDVFPFLHLRTWVEPDIGGMRAETAAVGSIILALAVYAVWRVRSRTTWFFAGLALFLVLAQAGWAPLSRAIHKLPLFDITLNERLGFGAAFALAILAAIGAEQLHRRAATITLAFVLAILAAGTLFITRSFVIDAGPRDWGKYTVHAELACLAAAVLFVRTRYALHALLALLLVQRVVTEGGVHKSFPRRVAYPPMKIFEPMKNVREPFRVAGVNWALLPGTNTLYGLEDVRGYEAMTFLPYQRTYPLWSTPQPIFFNRTDDLSRPFLSMLNVRFAFAYARDPVPPGWAEVAREGDALLLENMNVLPRAFVPQYVSLGLQSFVALDQMATLHDFREKAWIGANVVPYDRLNGPGRVTGYRRTHNGYTFEADMQGDGWVVISNCAWRGWRAYVDGRRVGMHRANVAFLSVHLDAGKHQVRLVYLPESFVVGRAVSLGTRLLWGAATARRRFRARQRRAAAPARGSSTLPQ
ncbi:MAG: YfhO family protein [Thermoanaerobaculia bacterium]